MSTEKALSGVEISKKAARLSRIAVTDAEHLVISPQLEKILGMFEQLQEINTDNVEPLANVVGEDLKPRADVVNDGGIAETVLGNAPDEVQGFYGVPKVVE